jgi:hypothetical protein
VSNFKIAHCPSFLPQVKIRGKESHSKLALEGPLTRLCGDAAKVGDARNRVIQNFRGIDADL